MIPKFRWWNTKHNKRIYGDFFRSRGGRFITEDGIVDNPLAEPEDWRVEPESVSLSTWLKDKNWTEIYEWDILESTRPAKEKYLVIWSKDDAAFYVEGAEFRCQRKISHNLESIIIGNIYKNSETFTNT